jgi:hypothetical protein
MYFLDLYNYQYRKDYNNAMAMWLFTFDSVNFFAPLWYAAFISKSFTTLYTLLIVEMAMKAAYDNAKAYLWIFYYMAKKRNEERKGQDEMELGDDVKDLASIINKQERWIEIQTNTNAEMMECEEEEIAEGYMEILKQFGYVAMFS